MSSRVLENCRAISERLHSGHNRESHEAVDIHGPYCGHEAVPHGDHVDYYLVDGHLHHPHKGHCDAHGPVAKREHCQQGV